MVNVVVRLIVVTSFSFAVNTLTWFFSSTATSRQPKRYLQHSKTKKKAKRDLVKTLSVNIIV